MLRESCLFTFLFGLSLSFGVAYRVYVNAAIAGARAVAGGQWHVPKTFSGGIFRKINQREFARDRANCLVGLGGIKR